MKARLKAGLTQSELATALGLHQQVTARYQKTGRIQDPARFKQIARVLKTSTNHLLGLDEPLTYYQIKDGVMRRFIGFVDQGIEQLPDGVAQKIADVVNSMNARALTNTPAIEYRRKKSVTNNPE